jgi:4-methyl-5(b-hydroxyethyl)-thiazole monophosphate biosynthesis
MTKRVLVPLSPGFEEIEAVTVIDILRRGEIEVVVAGLEPGPVTGRSSVTLIPDVSLDAALAGAPFDAIVLPGGLPNAHTLRDDPRVTRALRAILESGGLAGAICAAPAALDRAGALEGRRFTCHPTIAAELSPEGFTEDRVAISKRVVTSRAAGTAMEFAFALLAELAGPDRVRQVNEGVLAAL